MALTLIAYCGLDCAQCWAYQATQANDRKRMAEVAAAWTSEDYEVVAADVLCDGCMQSEGPIFKFCLACPIRACCRDRGYPNCAHCDDLPCDRLSQVPTGTTERLIDMQRALRA